VILAYASRFSASPGDPIDVMVSCDGPFEASVVRLIQADSQCEQTPYDERPVDAFPTSSHAGSVKPLPAGSHLQADDPGPWDASTSFSLGLWVRPTRQVGDEQVVWLRGTYDSGPGLGLTLRGLRPALWMSDGAEHVVLAADGRLAEGDWSYLLASYDADRQVASLTFATLRPGERRPQVASVVSGSTPAGLPGALSGPLLVAAARVAGADGRSVGHRFNGRIADPVVYEGTGPQSVAVGEPLDVEPTGAVIAHWDFAARQSSVVVPDRGPHERHGELVNMPMRAVRGPHWDAGCAAFPLCPEQYNAIHFHNDDLEDAQWSPDLTLALPHDLESGVYAVKLQTADEEDYVPFFVTPPRRGTAGAGERPRLAVVFPTFTYLAYANEHHFDCGLFLWERTSDHPLELQLHDLKRRRYPDVGPSTYDIHADDSGCACYSSRLRPILNFRPKQRQYWTRGPRHFVADMLRIAWLDRLGEPCDVLTDEELHHDGQALDGYQVVMLAHHHEYWSYAMRVAVDRFVQRGGDLMNLGGNTMWWVTAVHPERPHVVEIRKDDTSLIEPRWGALAAERHLASTGEQGGLWRNRGYDPSMSVLTTMISEGWDRASYYVRTEASHAPEYAFVFEGVTEPRIGTDGLALGGAAGDEYDHVDYALGSPRNTVILASSVDHSPFDEIWGNAFEEPDVVQRRRRSDLAYVEHEDGGRVFSAGSMCWIPAMAHNDFDNPVERITRNVLRHFLGETA
jgi:N,N-dimethylformamidase